MTDNSVAQADLVRLMEVLGISTHARSESPHEVFENEVLPAIERLKKEWAFYRSAARAGESVD